MKKEYESPEIDIEYFAISSYVCNSGFGWEEEEDEIYGYGYGYGYERSNS